MPFARSLAVFGINLLEDSKPVHHDVLEDALVGKANPFSTQAVKTVRLYFDGDFKDICYATIWNIACKCLDSCQATDKSKVFSALRSITGSCDPTLEYLLSAFLTPKGYNDWYVSTHYDSKDVNVPDETLDILEEEGIPKECARKAISVLVNRGDMRISTFKYGGMLYAYSEDRRRVVSRILNIISSLRASALCHRQDRP